MAKNSCQKKPIFLEILGTKVVQFWCYTKLIKTKKLLLSWYFSTKIILERFKGFLTLKIDIENQILALFDVYFWPFNKSLEKINTFFLISAIIASIWNVFIKFRWHGEKLFFRSCAQLSKHCQKLQLSIFYAKNSPNLSIFFSLKNISLGADFLVLTLLDNFNF